MKCPSCEASLDEIAKFCGQCGKPVPSKSDSSLGSRDLFEIPEEEPFDSQDEFIQEPTPPSEPLPSMDSSDDFFPDLNESSSNPEPAEETRKVFSEEDDPTVETQTEGKFKDAKIDKKTLKKIRKKSLSQTVEYGAFGAIGYFVLHLFYWLSPMVLLYGSWAKSNPRWYYLIVLFPLFLWPLLRTRGWNLRFSSHLTYFLGVLISCMMLFKFRNTLHEGDSVALQLTNLTINWDLNTSVLFSLCLLLQLTIAGYFRSKLPVVILIVASMIIGYGSIEVFMALSGQTALLSSGSGADFITPLLKPYLGGFALYFSPHFVLTHGILPLIAIFYLVLFFIRLFQKKFSGSLSQLCLLLSTITLWLTLLVPFERIPAELRPINVLPYLRPICDMIDSFLSLV